MESRLCLVNRCGKLKKIGRLCVRHYGEKFWVKLRLTLEEIFHENYVTKTESMLPNLLSFKDLTNFLNFLRISYNLEDLKLVFRYSCGLNSKISRDILVQFIPDNQSLVSEPNESDIAIFPENFNTVIDEGQSVEDEQDFFKMISLRLQKKFINCELAFKNFSSTNFLSFFQMSRMLDFLKIEHNERIIKECISQYSSSGKLSREQFKKLFYNMNSLCKMNECRNFSNGFFGFCSSHTKSKMEKGKMLVKLILDKLDSRTQKTMQDYCVHSDEITLKNIKGLFSPYCFIRLNDRDWENVTIYISVRAKVELMQNDISLPPLSNSHSSMNINYLTYK